MKKIYKSVLVVLAAATLTSCGNSWLDESPSNGADTEIAIDNYAKALNALYGVYDGLQGSSSRNEYYGARMLYYGDVRAEYMQSTQNSSRTRPTYEMNYTASNAPTIWEIPYNVIRRANSLLDAIEKGKVADGKEADLADMKGQCLTVRALAHFDLCRIYGKPYQMDNGASYGVPIVTKPVNPYDGEGLYPSRNSVKEVYDQVISDLTTAIPLLKTTQTDENGYINQGAAKALLSRVYLYKGDNTNALAVAKEVIASGSYQLWKTDEYVSGWSKPGSKEMIFEIVNKGTDDWVDREAIGYLMAESGY
ncbi:MAG: RagB/SusD family nutrient uptake outer membrane protein, partial [Tannerellaceae bacterium]